VKYDEAMVKCCQAEVMNTLITDTEPKHPDTAVTHMNGVEVDRETAHRLAKRLFILEGIQRADVVKHLDKDNDFSRAVGEEYLKFFDFTGQSLDHALRSFLKVVVLIGETQERERVLQHFSCRFHQCNPDSFPSSGEAFYLAPCRYTLFHTDKHKTYSVSQPYSISGPRATCGPKATLEWP
uniref:SEC7 domain-containing protein n=1 Tax=Amphiprion percula TaxID=161767 RepID=A0A3P8T5S8_AMPPE